jgi:hypothetical protein
VLKAPVLGVDLPSVQCPKCGAFNPEGFSSCGICGKSLREGTDDAFWAPAPTARAPQAANSPPLTVRFAPTPSRSVEQIASGQKLISYAILINVGLYLLGLMLGEMAGLILGLLAIGGYVLALIGVGRISSGLGDSTASRILQAVALLVPIVSLVVLFSLNSRASKALKAAGYKIGFLGAVQPRG